MNQSNSSKKDYAVIANRIAAVLCEAPMTAAEINTVLGKEYTRCCKSPNAVKFISGAFDTLFYRQQLSCPAHILRSQHLSRVQPDISPFRIYVELAGNELTHRLIPPYC